MLNEYYKMNECNLCGKKFPNSELVYYNNTHFCEDCYDEILEEEEEKDEE
jgi:formylmethanofuran dehydrogenase subunit E